MAGPFQPVGNQILNGRHTGDLSEKTAEILGVAGDRIGELAESDGLLAMFLYVRDNGFVAGDLPRVVFGYDVRYGAEEPVAAQLLKELQQ